MEGKMLMAPKPAGGRAEPPPLVVLGAGPRGGRKDLEERVMSEIARKASIKNFLLATSLAVASVAPAHAEHRQLEMPSPLINERCRDADQDYEGKLGYQAPSWRNGGECKDVLVVDTWGVWSDDITCFPLAIRQSHDTAPSGTSYSAVITCDLDKFGDTQGRPVKMITLDRYKGNMSVEIIWAALPNAVVSSSINVLRSSHQWACGVSNKPNNGNTFVCCT
jgi:hypothetical protein